MGEMNVFSFNPQRIQLTAIPLIRCACVINFNILNYAHLITKSPTYQDSIINNTLQ